MFLAASVFFAIEDAVRAAREDSGETKAFNMDSPATCERIRMACLDHLTQQVRSYCTLYRYDDIMLTIGPCFQYYSC